MLVEVANWQQLPTVLHVLAHAFMILGGRSQHFMYAWLLPNGTKCELQVTGTTLQVCGRAEAAKCLREAATLAARLNDTWYAARRGFTAAASDAGPEVVGYSGQGGSLLTARCKNE